MSTTKLTLFSLITKEIVLKFLTFFFLVRNIQVMLKTLKQQIFAQKVYLCYAMQYHCNRKDCRKLHIITFLVLLDLM